jgi:hypothetical protein
MGTHYSSLFNKSPLKIFTEKNIGDKDVFIEKTKSIIAHLITLAENVIGIYNEFLNGTKSVEVLIDDMERVIPLIDKYYFAETELSIPPIELNAWSQCCSYLSGTIHDFTDLEALRKIEFIVFFFQNAM